MENRDILERSIERYLRKIVIESGGMCLKWVCPQHRGVPDRLVLLKSKVYFVEIKSPKGVLSRLQHEFAWELVKHGYIHHVVRTKEQADEFVKGVLNGTI